MAAESAKTLNIVPLLYDGPGNFAEVQETGTKKGGTFLTSCSASDVILYLYLDYSRSPDLL